jgi:hypothetical protein
MIVLPNGNIIKIIGKPGSKLLTEMLIEYNDGKPQKDLASIQVDYTIFLGGIKEIMQTDIPKTAILISILSKEDYEFIQTFCRQNNLPLLVASPKKVFTSYEYLKLPIYNYINIAISLLINVLIKNHLDLKGDSPILINVSQELLFISPEKFFHLRCYPKNNLSFLYEPGTNLKGLCLTMEWIRSRILEDLEPVQIHTVIDIDEIPKIQDSILDPKDYLLHLTTLAQYQNSFLIVNTEFESESEDSVPFDYTIYTSIMEVWNNSHFIPKRKQLSEPLKEYEFFRSKDLLPLDFLNSIKKPPIFILDNFDSIKQFISDIHSKAYILYIGKRENYLKIIE